MFGGSSFARALREAAPGLTRRYFSCQCQALPRAATGHTTSRLSAGPRLVGQLRPRSVLLRGLQKEFKSKHSLDRSFTSSTRRWTSQELAGATGPATRSYFPKSSSNVVAYWLLGSAASVYGIVVFGGLTRLTESGLSITEWKPVTGSLPPMSDADWASEFLKYQSSPEFHLLNSRMTLEEFKSIYWMEWIHRVWGRAIGLTFVLPAIYFVARRQVSRPMALRIFGIAGLIGFQGFLGWWMVKSGLKDDLFAPGSHPRVSQYRLTAHLGAAFIVYTSMLWNGLSILRTNKLLSLPPSSATLQLTALRHPALRPFQIATAALCALVFATAMSGGLVAGLDAGLIYNDFPYMGVGLTPPKSELFDKFYSHVPADERGEHSDLVWRNMLENPSLVQLDHRVMATATFTAVMALFAYSRFSPNMVKYLPAPAKKAIHGVVGFAWLQVILGISTLLYLVPTPLASAHQAGSLALLSYCFVLGGKVWVPRAAARVLEERISQGAYKKVVGEAMRKANTDTASREVSGASGAVMAAMPLLCLAGFFASTPRAQAAVVAEAEEERCDGVVDEQKRFLRRQKNFKSCEAKRML